MTTQYHNWYRRWRAEETARRIAAGKDGNVTQDIVAKEADVNRKVIVDLENGRGLHDRRPITLGKLSHYYGRSVDELLDGDGREVRASDPVPPGFGVGPGESPSRRGRPNEDD